MRNIKRLFITGAVAVGMIALVGVSTVEAKTNPKVSINTVYSGAKSIKGNVNKKITKTAAKKKTYKVVVKVKRNKKVIKTKTKYLTKSTKGTYSVSLGKKLKKGDKVTVTFYKKSGKKYKVYKVSGKSVSKTITIKNKPSSQSNQSNGVSNSQNSQVNGSNLTVEDIRDGEDYEANGGYYDYNDDGTFKILAARLTKDGELKLKWGKYTGDFSGYYIYCGNSRIYLGDTSVTSGTFTYKDTSSYISEGRGEPFESYTTNTIKVRPIKKDANGKTIMLDAVSVVIDGDYLVEYRHWRKEWIQENLTDSMTANEKISKVKDMVCSTFVYDSTNGLSAALYAYGKGDCVAGGSMIVEFARDLGLEAELYYVGDKYMPGGTHYECRVLIDGEWVYYNGTPHF